MSYRMFHIKSCRTVPWRQERVPLYNTPPLKVSHAICTALHCTLLTACYEVMSSAVNMKSNYNSSGSIDSSVLLSVFILLFFLFTYARHITSVNLISFTHLHGSTYLSTRRPNSRSLIIPYHTLPHEPLTQLPTT